MTTRVTVEALGWPVRVTEVKLTADGITLGETLTVVSPMTTRDFYVHSTTELHVKQVKETQP